MQDYVIQINNERFELTKAMKQHKCKRCGKPIRVGKHYLSSFSTYGIRFDHERNHIGCGLKGIDAGIDGLKANIKKLQDYKLLINKMK